MPGTEVRTEVLERSADGEVVLSELPGGLRLITESMPGARSVSVGIWVGVGSIDEQPAQAGASHFLEHLLFKGTRRRSSAEISNAIDAVGGELNAFTSHEYTCYHAHVLAADAALAVDVVADVVLHALIAESDVDVERQVILEEIAMREDDPVDTLADTFSTAVFPHGPLGRPVAGSVATVEAMTRRQIRGYYQRRYRPEGMVVAIAGRVGHQDALEWVRAAFGSTTASSATKASRLRSQQPTRGSSGRFLVLQRDTEQAHLSVGMRGLNRADQRIHALAVLSTALGGGSSSRLFRAIREERGLVYSCYTDIATYASAGSFSVDLACQPDSLAAATEVLADELRLVRSGLTDAEMVRAKGQLIGSTTLELEDCESRMHRIGRRLLTRGDYRPLQADVDAIAAVTGDDVRALLGDLFDRPLSAALLGPYAGVEQVPAHLQELVGRGIRR